jgi:protein-tyrosine-phosphatase
MGEAIARQEAADVMEVFSAGLYPLGMIPDTTKEVLEEQGYSVEGLVSKGLHDFETDTIDLVVNMSGMNTPHALANFESVEEWEVTDPYGGDAAVYRTILREIQGRVKELARKLREAQAAPGERQ